MTTRRSEPEYRARVMKIRQSDLWWADVRPIKHFSIPMDAEFNTWDEAYSWACAVLRRLADDIRVGGSE